MPARGDVALAGAGLLAAGAVGWLAVHQTGLAVVLALAACAAPLALSSGMSVRGGALALALAGHLLDGPLYVQGRAPGSLPLALDFLILSAFALLAFQERAAPRPWRVATLALVALVLLQALNPMLPSIGYGVTGARAIAIPLLLLVAVGSGRLTRSDERAIAAIAAIGWTVNVIFAGRQWLVGFSGAELDWIKAGRSTYLVGDQIRLIGAMRSNQDFAFLVAIAFPAVWACVLARGASTRWRAGFGVLAVATIAVMFGSLVRSGLVAGSLGALGVAVALARDPSARQRLVAAVLALAVVAWFAVSVGTGLFLNPDQAQTLGTRVSSIFAPSQDYAFQQRQTRVWPHALREMEAHPLGAGAGSAGPLTQARDDAPLGALVPDDGYLLVGVQFGWFGLALFVTMLALVLGELWRRARRGATAAAAGLGAVVALCVAMVTGNFISLISPSCVWAVLVGLGLRAERP
jgi:hypothetical protein